HQTPGCVAGVREQCCGRWARVEEVDHRARGIGQSERLHGRAGLETLQAAPSKVPIDQLSPTWRWLSGGQWHTATGASPQFSARGIPGGTLVPVELSVTDTLGVTTTASSTIHVTPAGFSPLDAHVFGYRTNSGSPALF